MYRQILSVFMGTAYCLLSISTSYAAADKVVGIPMASRLFQGDQYQTISNTAFTPNSDITPYSRPVFINTYGYLELKTALTAFTAPAILPDGAMISQVSTYIEGNGINCKMTFA